MPVIDLSNPPLRYVPAKIHLLPPEERRGFEIECKKDLFDIPHIKKLYLTGDFIELSQYKTKIPGGTHSLIAEYDTPDKYNKYEVIGYLTNIIPDLKYFCKK